MANAKNEAGRGKQGNPDDGSMPGGGNRGQFMSLDRH